MVGELDSVLLREELSFANFRAPVQSPIGASLLTSPLTPLPQTMQTALVLVAKQTALALAPRVVTMAPALQVAVMSTQRALTTQAQENRRPVLFRKDDEKEMRKLLRKMHLQACYNDKTGFRNQIEHDKQTLGEIPGLVPGVDLTQEQVDALLNWKHLH
ncbi:hypothetical protein F442_13693 [Phytophthora nicotianae P10297]|uniref:Uncharacterized protein n=3 Tax=Phytophthora nicotianae TaxID=4792 RepID=V9ENN6_PHYNI|nr:hypothetical protein F443_13856 [Phytophthora nicotianae P1569]ETL87627.1 hypothetical protein L917_13205 [Phytophthora nicotianae]ETM40855.1 hypothetical protein L914_13300 [Phytophthora nicotianae]ETP38768.1 hypothetical protein F442_13693 [Phytophthora nicotianae P10297]